MRTLIFMKESDLKPAGGPAGFCYNILQEMKKQGITNIEFLPCEDTNRVRQMNVYRQITRFLPKWINDMQIAYRRKKDYQSMIDSPKIHDINFSNYGVVHFHSTISLYKYRKDLENYDGVVVLTTHSPVPQHQEVFAELPTEWEKRKFKDFYSRLDVIDEYAFNRADYVVFPCEDAEESYLKNWDKYKVIHDSLIKQGKMIYIPTGIEPKEVKRSRITVCHDYSLDPNSFIVSYAGRHNQVKGYDLLQEIAQKSWDHGDDYHFVICGKESPISGLNDSRWTEVGWTNDSQSIIAASDVFVLPNRETYFDIIMLEVLSCGKLVVASRTGGNKYFEKIGASGVFLYDTIEEAVAILERIQSMSLATRQELEAQNAMLFKERFVTEKYLQTYTAFLNRITSK